MQSSQGDDVPLVNDPGFDEAHNQIMKACKRPPTSRSLDRKSYMLILLKDRLYDRYGTKTADQHYHHTVCVR